MTTSRGGPSSENRSRASQHPPPTNAQAGGGRPNRRPAADRGQTTAEYALVLVGAATIAMLVVTWASSTGRISGLLDTVLRSITALVA